jgi:hypothetical protein
MVSKKKIKNIGNQNKIKRYSIYQTNNQTKKIKKNIGNKNKIKRYSIYQTNNKQRN